MSGGWEKKASVVSYCRFASFYEINLRAGAQAAKSAKILITQARSEAW